MPGDPAAHACHGRAFTSLRVAQLAGFAGFKKGLKLRIDAISGAECGKPTNHAFDMRESTGTFVPGTHDCLSMAGIRNQRQCA
jgi:hypothetical protein